MRASERANTPYIILFYVLLFTAWQVIVLLSLVPDYIFPSPLQVATRIVELWQEQLLWASLKATLARMATGFVIATTGGIALGLVMGSSPISNACLKSLFLGLSTLPTAAWAPLALILFGLSDRSIYFVIIMSAAPAIAVATSDAIRHIPVIYIRAARTLGTSTIAMPFRILLPAAFPGILTGIKLGWTLGWHGAVSAELIKSSVGLGYLLHMGRELNDIAQVLGTMIITIMVGILLDRFLFAFLERKVRRRWGLEQ